MSARHIFHGEVLSQSKFPSGYVIKLKQKHADGSPLEIRVQPGAQTNSQAGATLWAKLAVNVAPGSKVFVHGQ